jgi:hypothetical protein
MSNNTVEINPTEFNNLVIFLTKIIDICQRGDISDEAVIEEKLTPFIQEYSTYLISNQNNNETILFYYLTLTPNVFKETTIDLPFIGNSNLSVEFSKENLVYEFLIDKNLCNIIKVIIVKKMFISKEIICNGEMITKIFNATKKTCMIFFKLIHDSSDDDKNVKLIKDALSKNVTEDNITLFDYFMQNIREEEKQQVYTIEGKILPPRETVEGVVSIAEKEKEEESKSRKNNLDPTLLGYLLNKQSYQKTKLGGKTRKYKYSKNKNKTKRVKNNRSKKFKRIRKNKTRKMVNRKIKNKK